MMKKSQDPFRFKQLAAIAAILAASLMAVACDDGHEHNHDEDVNCDLETRAQTYVAGLAGADASEVQITLLESVPGPPVKGDSTWRIQVTDMDNTPLDGLTVTVTPFMPDHGHGTPIAAEVSELAEPGEYEAGPVNLWMPGLWETTVEVTDGADMTDAATFSFCIEG